MNVDGFIEYDVSVGGLDICISHCHQLALMKPKDQDSRDKKSGVMINVSKNKRIRFVLKTCLASSEVKVAKFLLTLAKIVQIN